MKLIIGNWCFCPRLITSLLALVFFSLFISLGFWQLDRADYKRTLYSDFENRQSGQAIDLNHDNTKLSDKEEKIWRHVNAAGEFLVQYQILLDKQVELGQAGYYIYNPFKLKQSEHVVLVNRGWLSAGNDRTVSPEIIMTNGLGMKSTPQRMSISPLTNYTRSYFKWQRSQANRAQGPSLDF